MRRTVTDGATRAGPGLVLIGFAFVASRLAILALPPLASDVGIYERYAREQGEAAREGRTFYAHHAHAVGRRAEAARRAGTLAGPIDEYRDVEYPPLALAAMRLAALWGGPGDGAGGDAPGAAYRAAFRAGLAVVDGGLFLLLVVLVPRYFPDESGREGDARLLVYVAGTLVLGHLLYDRLDLVLAALVAVSLGLLTSRRHYTWSFAVLAGAVLFKVVPAVLVPLWVLGAMPASRPLALRRPRVASGLAGRAALLLGMIVAGFLPFYLRDGGDCLGFLRYHAARPVEVGSVYGSVPLALRVLGRPVAVRYSYGSINLDGPGMHVLAALAPWLAAGALAAGTGLAFMHLRRISLQAGKGADGVAHGATLAQAYPLPFVGYTLLLLMLYIATGKVFSTQYLLWLAPLVALVPLDRARRRAFAWTFLLVCVLSTVLVPFLFASDLVDAGAPKTVPRTLKEPTVRVAALLVLRNVVFVGLVAALARWLRGSGIRDQGSGIRDQ